MHALMGGIAALASLLFVPGAVAQEYPNRPVRLVIPWAPGGTTDVVGRILSQKLTEYTGQQWVVENRGGATGTVGHALAAKAAPDGYTLLFATNSTFAIAPHVYKTLQYDNDTAFTPISLSAVGPAILSVHPSLPVRNVRELISLTKSKPGQVLYATAGSGSTSHLATELFMSMADIRMIHVPYKGGAPALVALLGGETALSFVAVSTALPHARAGRVRPLGTSTLKRTSLMPDLPAISETVPGFEMVTSYAMFAPAGTPANIIARVHRDVTRALGTTEVKALLENQGLESIAGSPDDLARHQKSETAKWGRFISRQSIKFE